MMVLMAVGLLCSVALGRVNHLKVTPEAAPRFTWIL